MKKYITLIHDFLTKNTSSKQTVIKNTFWLLLAEGVSKGLNIILMFWLAKLVSVEIFGQWGFINAIVGVLIVLVDLGMQQIYVRDIIKTGVNIEKHIYHSVIIKGVIGVLVLGVLFILSFYVPQFQELQYPIMIFMIYTVLYNINEFLRSVFRGKEQMETEAYIKILSGIVLVLIVGYSYLFIAPLSLSVVCEYYLISIIAQILITLYFLYKQGIATKLVSIEYDYDYIVKFLKSCAYLGITQLCMYAFFQMDQIIMRLFHMNYELGIYSAMYRIVQLLFFVTNTFLFAYMPHMLKSPKSPHKQFHYLMWGLRGCIITGFLLFGSFVIEMMYTIEYIVGLNILLRMLVALFFMMENMTIQQKLLSEHRESALLRIYVLGLMLNIIGNYFAIQYYGMYGAVGVMIVTQAVVYGALRWKSKINKIV